MFDSLLVYGEKVLPIVVIGGFITFLIFMKPTAPDTVRGQKTFPTKIDVDLVRPNTAILPETGEPILGNVVITHKASNDTIAFDVLDGYVVHPKSKTGLFDKYNPLDEKTDEKWSVTYTKKEYIFDPGVDLGTYVGYLTNTNGTNLKSTDIGVRFSPIRIAYNYFAPDVLASNQSVGLGISFYPRPESYGVIWKHIGLGYARVYNWEDEHTRNLFYLSFATRF